jgi:hypothetical protein
MGGNFGKILTVGLKGGWSHILDREKCVCYGHHGFPFLAISSRSSY